jgi:hypothetical protein
MFIALIINKIVPWISPIIKMPNFFERVFKKIPCCINNIFAIILGLFFCKKDAYDPLPDETYLKRFIGNNDTPISVPEKDLDRLKESYKKAWECRDFEIDKFWSRSAFFWGFIVLIFTGYITLITNDTKGQDSSYIQIEYLDFYFILLGFLFTLAWFLVIKGSKAWQENWEAHIDQLEDFISGPLYKTVWFSKQNKFYSVSKINEILALIILFVWGGMIYQYISQYEICIPFFNKDWQGEINRHITAGLFLTLVFSVILCFGYPASKYNLTNGILQKLKIQNKKGAFIDRYQKKDKP